ncbi:helix-turn-helix domain-containing protein [Brucepastera parasyntrophica]|uniref:helix-turn-helix domain-containing protein n=1 Tax=Brucepastera parasyntrophica TaxID=2880008 RepID=UPI00210B5428|nr:helix-turn-helix domain-containing protein [Brucepastera parasyntrophica]ULQ59234.1 helix-turn-helix domain-containing protein [Brucepastera parasyntrophica]
MFQFYKITIDEARFQEQLKNTGLSMKKIARRMMGRVAGTIKKEAKKNVTGLVLQRRSGDLSKSLSFKTKPDFTAIIRSGSIYASTHEMGETITAKNGNYLTFKINETWVKVQSVIIPKQEFLWPVIEFIFSTGKANALMDEVLQDALKKLFADRSAPEAKA